MPDTTPTGPRFSLDEVLEFAPRCAHCGQPVTADAARDPRNDRRIVHARCVAARSVPEVA